jgi:uncharacterized protein (DUF1499 family)
MRRLTRVAAALVAIAALTLVAARLGAFAGGPPADLGVRDGRLAPPSMTDNSVHSQAGLWSGHPQSTTAAIDPLPARGDRDATMAALADAVAAQPGAAIVERRVDYLRVEFTTRWMRFVDDAEFWFDPAAGVVQVRSASRLGESDLGVNRARIEAIRTRLAAG